MHGVTQRCPVLVVVLVLLVRGASVAAQDLVGTGEFCTEVEYQDAVGPLVDSLHVVLQGGDGYDEQSSPWFDSRGMKSAPGVQPTLDSLVLFLTIEGRDLFVVRTQRLGAAYVGEAGYSDGGVVQDVRLRPFECPWA